MMKSFLLQSGKVIVVSVFVVGLLMSESVVDHSQPLRSIGGAEAWAMRSELPLHACTLAESIVPIGQTDGRQSLRVQLRNPARQAEAVSEWCYGYIPEEPSFCLRVEREATYTFEVINAGDIDTMMLLAAPQHENYQCDDDSAGDLRPMIQARLTPGVYELYIGSYELNRSGPVSVEVGMSQ